MSLIGAISRAARGFYTDVFKTFRAAYDLGTAAFTDERKVSDALSTYTRSVSEFNLNYLSSLGDISQQPGPKQAIGALDWAYRNVAGRPASTVAQQSGKAMSSFPEVMRGESPVEDLSVLFDPQQWRTAYNKSGHISPGQAVVSSYTGEDPEALKAQGKFDHDNYYKYGSGAVDFLSQIFLDPTIVGGKLAQVGKLKYVKPMTGRAIADGGLETYLSSKRADRVYKTMLNADSARDVRTQLLNDNVNGAQAASVLFQAAKTGSRHVWDSSVRALYGDTDAYDDLLQYNMALKRNGVDSSAVGNVINEVGRTTNGMRNGIVRSRLGTKNEELFDWDEYMAENATRFDALLEAGPIDEDLLASAFESKALVGEKQLRVSYSSKFRTRYHQAAYYSPGIKSNNLKALMQKSLVTNRIPRVININSTDADKALANYLERAELPKQAADKLVSDFMAATSNSAKFVIISRAEDVSFATKASKFGMSEEDITEVLAKANEGRARARDVLSVKHRFRSRGLTEEAIQDLEARGFMDDDGFLALYATPDLETQTADLVPLADMKEIDRLLRSGQKTVGSLGARLKTSPPTQAVTNGLEAFHQLWKPLVLARLGWPIRAFSDEFGRNLALHSSISVFANGARAAATLPIDAYQRGRSVWHAWRQQEEGDKIVKLRNPARSKGDIRGEVIGDVGRLDLAGEGAVGGSKVDGVYSSLEAAFVDGRVDVDSFVSYVRTGTFFGDGSVNQTTLLRDLGGSTPEYRRAVVEDALERADHSWYTKPFNQRQLYDQVNEDGAVTVNPLTGDQVTDLDNFTEVASMVSRFDDAMGRANPDDAYDFVYAHVDDLLLPGRALRSELQEDGSIALKVIEPTGQKISAGATILTGDRHLDMERVNKAYTTSRARSMVNRGFTVKALNGENIHVEGSMEGTGEMYRQLTSSQEGLEHLILGQIQKNADRFGASVGWTDNMLPGDPLYGSNWERVAVKQVGQDRAARQFLEGRDLDYMADIWLRTDEGVSWAKSVPPGNVTERLRRIQSLTDSYVPDVVDKDGLRLRELVLRGDAQFRDLDRMVPNMADQPQIHAEQFLYENGKHTVWSMYKKGTGRILGVMSKMQDRASRFPFFDQAYRQHMQVLSDAHVAVNQRLTPAAIDGLQKEARKRAMSDVRKWLYNHEAESDVTHSMRFFVPFANAMQDSLRAYSKIATQENPAVIGRIWQIWTAAERNGLITDEEGRELRLEDGKEAWYEVHPETGKRRRVKEHGKTRYITFKLPSWASPDQFGDGVRVPVSISKDAFNTILNFDHPAGPLVQFPMNALFKDDPRVMDSELGKFILPFGPQQDNVKTVMPASVKKLYERWRGEDDPVFAGQVMAIYSSGVTDYNLGKRDSKPTMKEAQEKAASLSWLRFWTSEVAPVTVQYKSPYQPYIDHYRQLKAANYLTADEDFYKSVGEEFFWFTGSVTRNVSGVPPTMAGYNAFKKYEDLMSTYPEVAGLVTGLEGGEFSKAVYEWQKGQVLEKGGTDKMRQILSPTERAEDIERRLVWIKYGKLMDGVQAELVDRGLTSWRQNGAEDLAELRDGFIQKYTLNKDGTSTSWYDDFIDRDVGKKINKLAGLRTIASHPDLIKRDDIDGLADYFVMRDEFKAELRWRKESGYSGKLSAEDNIDLRTVWEESVFKLTERNVSFAQVYNRYLANDYLDED